MSNGLPLRVDFTKKGLYIEGEDGILRLDIEFVGDYAGNLADTPYCNHTMINKPMFDNAVRNGRWIDARQQVPE